MTHRLSIHALDPTGATDGQVPTYDAATGRVVWADGSTGGGSLALDDLTDVDTTTAPPADGDVLVYDATAGLWVPGTVSGGGGSGGGGSILLDNGQTVADYQTANGVTVPTGTIVFMEAPPATTWDFRTLSALPSGWTRRGVTSETFGASGLTATLSAGQGYQYAHSDANTDYTLEALVSAGSFASTMMGVMANVAAGNGTASFPYNGPSGVLIGTVDTSYQYGGTFSNGGGTPAYPMLLRLRKSSGTFYASMSTDAGATWTTEVSMANAGTYTSFGFGSILGSATTMTVGYVKFTPASGSSTTSGLRGWWDGSAIVPF